MFLFKIVFNCYKSAIPSILNIVLSSVSLKMAFNGSQKCYSTVIMHCNDLDLLNPIWTGGGGGGWNLPPLRFFLHNSKTPGDIEKKISDFNFTPLMDILHILAITILVRCCHSNLLFPVCHVIFWVEKTKKVELFSR